MMLEWWLPSHVLQKSLSNLPTYVEVLINNYILASKVTMANKAGTVLPFIG